MDEWKVEVLKQANLGQFYELGVRELVLLFILSDGGSPVAGEEVLHMCLFLYPYIDASLSPSLLLPRISEIEKAVEALEAEGLVERRLELVEGRYADVLRLTERGVAEAKRLHRQVQASWVVLRGVTVRRGADVLGELEALKRTYNRRSAFELFKLLVSKLESEGENILWHVRGLDDRSRQSLLSLVKQLSKEIKSVARGSPAWF